MSYTEVWSKEAKLEFVKAVIYEVMEATAEYPRLRVLLLQLNDTIKELIPDLAKEEG